MIFSLPDLLVLVILSSRFFQAFLALLTIRSWYQLQAWILAVPSLSPPSAASPIHYVTAGKPRFHEASAGLTRRLPNSDASEGGAWPGGGRGRAGPGAAA